MAPSQVTAEPATAATAVAPSADEGNDATAPAEQLGAVSSRAKQLLGSFSGAYYFEGIGRAVQGGLWTANNPEGYTVLAVAENRQSIDLMQERLGRVPPVPRQAFFYDNFQGVERFRGALANMLMQTFMQGTEIAAEDIFVAAGCGAVLSAMFNMLGEAGEAVLIPAPYYPGFDFDTQASAGLKPWPVHCALPGSAESCVPGLAAAADAAAGKGHPARFVLLCHPNNPVGTCYTRAQLQDMLEWCLEQGIHLISDEVYANSRFGAESGFASLAALVADHVAAHPEAAERAAAFAHVVFGVSKDFCASGFRVGALWSRNKPLVKAAALAGYFSGVSNVVQHALSELFEDSEWLRGYVTENATRLGAAYAAISGALAEAGIPFVAADSTMMLWMDLRAYLPEPSWEGERQLWNRLADEQRVILTPGECCHGAEPGFFRACYAWMDDIDCLPITVQRIRKCLPQH